jgi:hypothetical protein
MEIREIRKLEMGQGSLGKVREKMNKFLSN